MQMVRIQILDREECAKAFLSQRFQKLAQAR